MTLSKFLIHFSQMHISKSNTSFYIISKFLILQIKYRSGRGETKFAKFIHKKIWLSILVKIVILNHKRLFNNKICL